MPRSKHPKKRLKAIPSFATEAAERDFWASHDTSDYADWGKARPAIFPNLHPSTETISLRLPGPLLADLKVLANQRDVPYQSLLKILLADQIRREQDAKGKRSRPVTRRRRAPR